LARYVLAQADEQACMVKTWEGANLLADLFLGRRMSEASAELLQTPVHQRKKLRRTLVITSKRVVRDWGRYLGDANIATTILNRQMRQCSKLEFEGRSYRLQESAARLLSPSD